MVNVAIPAHINIYINSSIEGNIGLNPIGIRANSFTDDVAGELTSFRSGGNALPTNNTVHFNAVCPCRANSTGGSNVEVYLVDQHNNTITYYKDECDVIVPIGWGIRFVYWGGNPTVTVAFY